VYCRSESIFTILNLGKGMKIECSHFPNRVFVVKMDIYLCRSAEAHGASKQHTNMRESVNKQVSLTGYIQSF
jgi:hypothetical protein